MSAVPTTLHTLLDDLAAETADLVSLLEPLDAPAWGTPTPAEGWLVRDQVSHLTFFDEAATTAVNDPSRFVRDRVEALRDVDAYTARANERGRMMSGREPLDWFATARSRMAEALRSLDAKARVPWSGPDMGVLSCTTARLTETWDHGQDVVDALGLRRIPTDRLRHVADIGVRTLPNSYRARGLPVPDRPVRVELLAPSGELWIWGDSEAADTVRGPAEDFCLVVTQRRHLADMDLRTQGLLAEEWMSIAQAFAGPPGAGRRPGQFHKESE